MIVFVATFGSIWTATNAKSIGSVKDWATTLIMFAMFVRFLSIPHFRLFETANCLPRQPKLWAVLTALLSLQLLYLLKKTSMRLWRAKKKRRSFRWRRKASARENSAPKVLLSCSSTDDIRLFYLTCMTMHCRPEALFPHCVAPNRCREEELLLYSSQKTQCGHLWVIPAASYTSDRWEAKNVSAVDSN